jgi:hypothetical protein
MKRTSVVGAVVLAAVIGAVAYLANRSSDAPVASQPSASTNETHVDSARPAPPDAPSNAGTAGDSSRPFNDSTTGIDPRLDALQVSPDNGLIEFVAGADGKIIKELDKDPGSPSFKKPLREYIYSGDRVIGLTSYLYVGDQVQITRTAVSYKPDGSIDQFRQSTN